MKTQQAISRTPTPWNIDKLPASGTLVIKGQGARVATIEETNEQANAAFICKAVNCYEELLEALDQCQKYIGLIVYMPQKVKDVDWEQVYNQARQAIQKAGQP